ncbi:MAG: hypothetical protein Q7S30_02080, partial [Candidatus Omnitrophota bacterium]|nr:hypothetical protein [Candidatus Omnitrophota bacterium]
MIFKTLSTETRLKRIVASIVAFSFLLSNIAFAETPKSNIAPDIKKPTEVVTDPEKIVISRDYGLVKSKFTGKDKKLVIHIQDAHCNYEAQSNIAKILESLIKNDGLSLVSVEGADGFIDTSWFKAFPDADIRKEVADYFMKKGEITGPELLSITTDYPIKLFGAETRSYYIENLNAFTTSYPLKEDTERYFNQIKAIINKLKTSIYSAELKDLDSKMQDYESKKLQFSDYVKFLETLAQEHKINLRQYENIFKLISVFIYEKRIDFKVVDKERSTLIDEITKKLDKDALADLVARSLAFKTSKISSAEYYDYLKKLAMHHGFDMMKDYPNLANYIIYNSVYSRIENEKLFNDIKALELAIKEKLFTNDDQRTLEKLSRHIDILLGLTNIKLLNGDFDYYKTNKDGFTHEVFADFIKKMAAKYGFAFELDSPSDAVKESLPKLEDFYAIAIKRDKALVDNTIQAMKKESAQICVLVTGGFHSEGITKLLEQQGLSYMVICPNITKDVETPYIKILTNQRTPMEEILTDSGVPVDAKAKQGMLAPLLATWAAPLDEDQIERLLSDVPFGKVDKDDLKRLVDGIVARMSDTKRNFEFKSIEKWIERALNVAYSHRYSHDISTIKDAYAFSMKTDLVNKRSKEKGGVALTTAEKKAIDKFVDALIGSKDFDSIFSDAHQSAFQRYVVHQEPSANQQHVMEGLVAESNRAKGTRSSSSGYDKTTPDDASRAKAVGATLSDDIIDKAISDPYTKYKVILDNGSVPANISAA